MAEEMGFCKLLNELIKDEEKAPLDYQKLGNLWNEEMPVPRAAVLKGEGYVEPGRPEDQLIHGIINMIIKDENKHKEILEVIKELFCE